MTGDARFILQRDGRAGRSAEGLIKARTYGDERALRCVAPAAGIRKAASDLAEQVDQLLLGEDFDVLDEVDGWCFGQARRDGYVGFVEAAALAPRGDPPTHRVSARNTYAFREPTIRARPSGPITLNSLLTVTAEEGTYAFAEGAGWVPLRHLVPVGRFAADPVAVAELLLGAAYVWGGREASGLDCSALVQHAHFACGRSLDRDTDLQARAGEAISADNLGRGDLVFWRGHVAMLMDAVRIIHANAHHMGVAIEPLAEAVARISAAGAGKPTAYRRL
ncbi:MAG: NlpC/P60 family protein [Phenylobacterium sp.]|uniref:C40 family peptidase n=1 Tax=Phenylobacterium sp. TaxID=1871053 RepID=UPI00273707CF|nr:NlpC/P60 family protein [Phenylobacterium sp.]MDP3175264.1 NlpC/P60 family protein [Phenylobacterium sp.]